MKHFRSKGVILLIFTFTVINFSCKKNSSFGLNVQPEGDILQANQTDTTTIISYSIKEDSLKVDELDGVNLLGSYNDPYFGSVKTSIISHIRLEKAYDFRPNGSGSLDSLIVDSVIMYLAIDGLYGNVDGQIFEVYQLLEDIYMDSSYYTNSSISTSSINLASLSSTIQTNPLVPGYVGSELVDNAILRIPLSINDFALPIMNESGNTSLDGNDGSGEFVEWFKGLLISTNNTQNINSGGIYYTNLLSEFSKISLYFRDTSGISSEHDTLQFDFNFNSNCARYHTAEIDYINTDIENELTDSSLGQDMFYIQGMGGTRAKLHFPFLNSITDSNIIVNKAELILPFQYYNSDPYVPASSLFLIEEDSLGEESFLPDFYESNHGGTANFTESYYSFNITRYINEIISGSKSNLPLNIVASGSGISANRTILTGFSTSLKDKPRLILTYSKY